MSISEGEKPESALEEFCSSTVSNRTIELIDSILSDLGELEYITASRNLFSESLSDIRKHVMEKVNVAPEMQRYTIMQESLVLLKNYLNMDYVGIWMIKDQELVASHEVGSPHSSTNFNVLHSQMTEAVENTKKGNIVYLCPSDSDNGGVDAIFVFRNIQNEPIGYLLFDDHDTENKIPDTKLGEVVQIFYERLKNLIYESELDMAKKEIHQVKTQLAEMKAKLVQAQYDKLTGLLMKQYAEAVFYRDLERIRRSKNEAYGCVCILDIDFFKKVNDTFGHRIGDEVLKKI